MVFRNLLLLFVTALLLTGSIFAETGNIKGRVIDKDSKLPLPGATLSIKGTNLGAVSDGQGYFLIQNVPVGNQVLDVHYIGYKDSESKVVVQTDGKSSEVIALTMDAVLIDNVIVTGMREGQIKALNRQKTADNIKNVVSSDLVGRFPDPNTAEALQRLPGISIQRDQGEGRYVLIRGMEARLSSVMINGQKLPSPEGDIRAVALDVIPSDIISSIEVNKAITPDMDADAIGGSVNVITKEASDYSGQVLKATLAGGYNQLVSDYNMQAALTYGNRFGKDEALGVLLSGSYYSTNRGSDNIEMEYSDWNDNYIVETLELRDYIVSRKRIGFSTTFDYKFNDNSVVYIKSIFNQFDDQEYRRRLTLDAKDDGYYSLNSVGQYMDDGELEQALSFERELKDRFESQQIYSVAFGGEHLLGDLNMDYQFAYSYAQEDEPDARYSTFVQDFDSLTWNRSNVNFPKFNTYKSDWETGTNALDNGIMYDYANYEFDEYATEKNRTTDNDITGQLNLEMPFQLGDYPLNVKAGVKYRAKNKDRNNNIVIYDGYDGETDLTLNDVLGDFEDENFLDNNYKIGYNVDPDKMNDYFENNKSNFEKNDFDSELDTYSENYEAAENIVAAYLQAKINFSQLMILAGARFESTNIEYTGWQFDISEDEEISRKQVTNTQDYSNIFPMLHAKYDLTENTIIRAAFTTSIARPSHFFLVPYAINNRADEERELGNPDLKPTNAMNFDMMFEHYFRPAGIISGGFFYKDLTDYIFLSKTIVADDDPNFAGFEQYQPMNGDVATLLGFELNWQHQLTFLPSFLEGFGVYLNYTYTNSTADYPMLDDDDNQITRQGPLPGQAENILNAALSYEKYGFRARLSANYHGDYVDEVGINDDYDIHYNSHTQLDFAASYSITDNFSVFFELVNLTNEPLRYFMGVPERPIQQEYYKMWGHFGVRYEM